MNFDKTSRTLKQYYKKYVGLELAAPKQPRRRRSSPKSETTIEIDGVKLIREVVHQDENHCTVVLRLAP